jgi:hypothetical protein
MRFFTQVAMLAALASASLGSSLAAQTPANDPSARLKEVLPADVADRVLDVIAKARARDLPAQALENRALKFAAKGVDPKAIEKSIEEQVERMDEAKDALQKGRGRKPADDEVAAGAEALRKGVDGAKVAELAKTAPSGRSLAVPLYVIGSLIDRGLKSDAALQRVRDRLEARASDVDLEHLPAELPEQAASGQGHKPAETGRDLAATKRPGSAAGAGQTGGAGGPPAGVPANPGARGRPATPPGQSNKPTNPGKKP